jgi:glycerol-3-phosphate acyltransferase PlsY
MLVILSTCALFGYLAGSIPFGLVLCYLCGYGDIRKIGSGNIGATNVLRTGNWFLALLTVLLDAFKAGIAAYAAMKILPDLEVNIAGVKGLNFQLNYLGAMIAGVAGILGHMFPVWLDFKGGKGVSSAFGFILITDWQVALTALYVWLVMAFLFRYSSLAALTACIAVPITAFFVSPILFFFTYTIVALLVIIRHHQNISRLLHGTESKISFKKKNKEIKK